MPLALMSFVKGSVRACFSALALFLGVASAQEGDTAVVPVPGQPVLFLSAFDLAPLGYTTEEFFVSGTASSYKLPGPPSPDGHWDVTPAETEALVDRVIDDGMGVEEALHQLDQISRRGPCFGPVIQVGAYAIAATGMAVVFGGGWREALLSSLIGALVGLAAQLLEQKRNQISLAPLVGGIISSLGGIVLGNLVPAASHTILILSGFIVLVPGLGLLVSMQELGTGNLVAGSSRLVGTGFVLMLPVRIR